MTDENFKHRNSKNNKVELELNKTNLSNVSEAKIKGVDGRFIYKVSDTEKAMGSVASAKMYNQIGIKTPTVKQIITAKSKDNFLTETIQPDVTKMEKVETCLAKDDVEYSKIPHGFLGKYKWEIFENLVLRERMLEFMTPECLTQLENVFLVDELRTDPDRTTLNYFLTKAKGSQKYEGVVVIDLENMLLFDYCRNGEKDDFKNFILYPYSTATPQQNQDVATYKQRVVDLKELIQSGSLSKDNITVLKNALTYDFPKEIKKACKERKLKGKKRSIIVDPVERLWEYNNNEIGKDLGL